MTILLCLGIGFPGLNCTVQVDAGDYVNACEPGYERCSNNEIQMCKDDGRGFTVIITCDDNESCQNATCVAVTETEIFATERNLSGKETSSSEVQRSGGGNSGTSPGRRPPPPYIFDGTTLGMKFQIQESLDGGLIDVGLCGGVPSEGALGAFCSSSLFYRIENRNNQLSGALYQTGEDNELFAHEGTALNIVEGEIYELTMYKEPLLEEQQELSLTISLTGASYGSAFYLATTIPENTFQSFGLWNFNNNGEPEEALSGSIVNIAIKDGQDIELKLMDFIQFTALEQFEWELDTSAEIASFYVSGEARNSAFFPLQILENDELGSDFSP